jgi:hypothetical protein
LNKINLKSIILVPVTVFEKKTVLERCATSFAYAPVFLEDAGQDPDPYS